MTTEEIDQLVADVMGLTRDQLVAEFRERVAPLWGEAMANKADKHETLFLRWYVLCSRAQDPYPMDPAGRIKVNLELDAAGLKYPFPPRANPAERAKHRLYEVMGEEHYGIAEEIETLRDGKWCAAVIALKQEDGTAELWGLDEDFLIEHQEYRLIRKSTGYTK